MGAEVGPRAGMWPRAARDQAYRILHGLRRVDRSLWALLLAGLIAVFLWRQRATVGQTLEVLRDADWRWTLTLLVSAVAMHAALALSLSAVFAALGFRIPLLTALVTHAERQTVSTVVPAGGVTSLLLLMRRFAPFGVTNNDALFAVVLFSVIGHLSFLTVLAPVLGWMAVQRTASTAMEIAAGALLLGAGIVTLLVIRVVRGAVLPGWLERRTPGSARAFLVSAQAHDLPVRRLAAPYALALLGDLLGMWCVYASLQAVGAGPSPGLAAAAYVTGTLFLLVAPIFQGLGLVELSMTLLLQHLGVPAPQALGATLLFRSGEVWLPVVFGIALQARHEKRLLGLPAHLPALWTAFNGVVAILSVMPRGLERSVRRYGPVDQLAFLTLPNASRTVILTAGFLLLLCAYSLLRRQRTAWVIALVLTSVVAVTQLRKDIDRLSAIIAAINVALLLLYRHRFHVRSDRPTMRRGLAVFALTLAAGFAYGIGSLWLIDRRHFGVEFSLRSAAQQTLDAYFSLDSAGLAPRTAYAEWLVDSFHVVGGLSVLIAVVSLLRPLVWRRRTMPAERERARALVAAYGGSSQDLFKTWPDKHQFFSSTNDGVVSFGTANGIALCLGDPAAADRTALRRVLTEFLDFCDANGWEPAFHQAGPRFLNLYREEGLVPLRIGAEAIVPVERFSLAGRKMKGLRGVTNRFARAGYRAVRHEPPLPADLLRRLREVSDAWLTLPGRRERGFTLGQFTEAYVGACPVYTIEGPEGRVEAFINVIPDGVPGETTFDMMRHRPDAPNGAMDRLLIAAIEDARGRGFRQVSLGMVPFVDPGTGEDTALRDRAVALLRGPLGRFFDAESLWRYKNKFGPVWEPRYLVYRHDARLPAIGLALARLTEGRRHDADVTS